MSAISQVKCEPARAWLKSRVKFFIGAQRRWSKRVSSKGWFARMKPSWFAGASALDLATLAHKVPTLKASDMNWRLAQCLTWKPPSVASPARPAYGLCLDPRTCSARARCLERLCCCATRGRRKAGQAPCGGARRVRQPRAQAARLRQVPQHFPSCLPLPALRNAAVPSLRPVLVRGARA